TTLANTTNASEIIVLPLHDALPISRYRNPSIRAPYPCWRVSAARFDECVPVEHCRPVQHSAREPVGHTARVLARRFWSAANQRRSEEHTSELQSRFDIVCRLLLEKK